MDLAKEILIFQNNYNKENDNLLEVKWTFAELQIIQKAYINENISKRVELSALKNCISFISNPLIEQFGNFLVNYMLKG